MKDGARLRRAAARALERGKPIVLLKGGETEEGARAARSHTAAITASGDVFRAFAEQYGIHAPDSMDEFLEVADFLARSKPIAGNRLGVVSFSGGLGALAADLATGAGFALPSLGEAARARLKAILPDYAPTDNPVDLVSLMVSQPDSQPLRAAGEAVASDESVDALLFLMGIYHHAGERIAREVKALFETMSVPLAFAWLTGPRDAIQTLKKQSVPVFGDYPRAIRGLEALLSLERAREAAAPERPMNPARAEAARDILRKHPPSRDGFLPPEACAAILDLYGIPRPREEIAETPEEALRAQEELESPVALKAVSGDGGLAHKTEAGGVLLGLSDPKAVLEGAEALLALAPDARVLVQEMVEGGVELLVGASHDPTFGPCVTAGPGGIHVETLHDAVRLLPPFDARRAERALSGLRSRALLDGFRGGPAVPLPLVSDIIVKVSDMALELAGELAEMEINPLIARAADCRAVDARMRARPRRGEKNA